MLSILFFLVIVNMLRILIAVCLLSLTLCVSSIFFYSLLLIILELDFYCAIFHSVPSDVRQAYRQFLASVREVIDGEFSSDDFQEVAVFIYGLFSVPDIDIKRRVFEKK